MIALSAGIFAVGSFAAVNTYAGKLSVDNGAGNPVEECQAHGASYFAKYDWEEGGYVKDSDGGVVDIEGDASGGTWSSDTAIDVMIVKGGTLRDPTTYDSENKGSFNNNEIENKDISHITFCKKNKESACLVCWSPDSKLCLMDKPAYQPNKPVKPLSDQALADEQQMDDSPPPVMLLYAHISESLLIMVIPVLYGESTL